MGSMKDQLGDDLFEPTSRKSHVEQLADSLRERDEAMARSEKNASTEWRRVMLELVTKTAREMPQFTTDDVFDRFNDIYADDPNAPKTHDRRAMGPVMSNAQRAGVCSKSNGPQVPSRRANIHATPLQIWISAIFGK